MELILKNKKKSNLKTIKELKSYYMRKYYNIFMHKWTIPELDYQQNHFLFTQLWDKGSFGIFPLKNGAGVSVITPIAELLWNIYNFPTEVNLINIRNAPFIPSKPQIVDKDCCICYALPSREAVGRVIEWNVERIVSAEILINICMDTHKLPYIIAVTPENKVAMKNVVDSIIDGESVVYADVNDSNSIKVLANNSPYIIDKLMQYKDARENEIKTILGIQNFNTQEKSQYINEDTTNSNNQEVEESGCLVLDSLQELAERYSDIFGITLTPKLRHEVKEEAPEEEDDENV